jgi:glycosyltransferase involved in cell wall biosynthesis
VKILIDHPSPFLLAHGGQQIQITETKLALEKSGQEVEFLRWWDESQQGDLIHYFGVPSLDYIQKAEAKGIPVLFTHLLSATCNRPDWKLRVQGLIIDSLLRLPGWGLVKKQLTWRTFRAAKRIVVGLEAEKDALIKAFHVTPKAISVVPLGLSEPFISAQPGDRSAPYLITTGTIYEVKRSVELALMAKAAGIPLLFVGKPYSTDAPYWHTFRSLIDNKTVFHRSHVADRQEMMRLLQGARGFVLYSQFENWCLSAQEAIACGLPLLVQDQKWSRERFRDQASYLKYHNGSENVAILRRFYDTCPHLPSPTIKIHSWMDVAAQLISIYEKA